MMFRSVRDLVPGDGVRPFDDRLWHVFRVGPPDTRGRDEIIPPGRIMVTFTHPTDGALEVFVCPDDLVRLA